VRVGELPQNQLLLAIFIKTTNKTHKCKMCGESELTSI
jgi:hypothetical protein